MFALSEQAVAKALETHGILISAQYAADRTAAMDALFSAGSRLHKHFAGVESVFEGSPFMGNAATPGDYMFAAACFMCNDLQGDFLDGFPKCKALMEHVFNMESVKAYLATVPYAYFKRNSD